MPTRKRLTDKGVAALKAKVERYEVFDGSGFGVRVTPRGIKSFVWMYRQDGRSRRLTLGAYPAMKVHDAHVALAAAQKTHSEGGDPGAKHVAERRAERQAETVAEVANEFLERHSKVKKRSWREDERILEKDVLPFLGRRKAHEITRRDIVQLLDRVVDRGAGGQAIRVLAVVRKMFNWAVGRELLEANPAWRITRPGQINTRDRVLTPDEIRAFWFGLEGAEMPRQARLALRLQLVTGQRIGEVTELPSSEVDVAAAMWSLPGARAKNKRSHRVPLSGLALEILAEAHDLGVQLLRRRDPDSEAQPAWVFPSNKRADAPITAGSVMRCLKAALPVLKIENVHTHDLRRTAATEMAAIGTPVAVVGKVLNHTEPGVTSRHYNLHGYDAEKRKALEAWARRLRSILGDPGAIKVVALHG